MPAAAASTLHVANGDETARGLTAAGVDGRILVHRDVLTDGPFPPDLPPSPAWHHRAGWMARHHGADGARYLVEEMALERDVARHRGDLVLWADGDCLHCAINLLHLLRLPTPARVRLAMPPRPRLGERAPADLARLAVEAAEVPAGHVALAKQACVLLAGDVAKLHAFVNTRLAAWPAMQEALRLRLRMPRLLDTVVLEALEAGPRGLRELQEHVAAEPALAGLGYGDASLRVHVKGMQEAGLVAFEDDRVTALRPGHPI